MNEPNLNDDGLEYEPMPPARSLTQARRILARLDGNTDPIDTDTERDAGDCDDCHHPVWIRHTYGPTPLALCSPCARRRQRAGERLRKEPQQPLILSEAA